MIEVCHRCGAELPGTVRGVEAALFCPHCSAPQILLPEYMRVESLAPAAEELPARSAGMHSIDWRAVLPVAAAVGAVGGVMSVLALKSQFMDFLAPLWVLISGSVVLGVYLRRRPGAWMSGQAGWRIGLVTGLLLVGAKGVGLSATGVVARYTTHSMAGFDAQNARNVQAQQAMMKSWFPAQSEDKEFREYQAVFARPEFQAGSVLGAAAVQALFVLVFAGLGGLFSGAVERRKRLVVGRG